MMMCERRQDICKNYPDIQLGKRHPGMSMDCQSPSPLHGLFCSVGEKARMGGTQTKEAGHPRRTGIFHPRNFTIRQPDIKGEYKHACDSTKPRV